MLPKDHLTSHSRMSDSRWVITPSWLSGSWRSFLYSSSVHFLPPLLNIFCFCRSVPFLSFIVPISAWNVPVVSLIEEISGLSHSIVFLYFFALVTEEGFLISPCSSLELFKWLYLSFSPFPFTSLLSGICKASSDKHFDCLHLFFLGGSWSRPPVQDHELLSVVLQALCLSDLVSWICHFHCIIHFYNHRIMHNSAFY